MAVSPRTNLACPFFVPLEIVDDGSWPHPSRLPLGAGWAGNCRASGQERPASDGHIREFCNLGYASACPHLPVSRDWDAIRFSVARAGQDQVTIGFVCELGHAPIEHGKLTFDLVSQVWLNSHRDARVQRLATCYLETYRTRTAQEIEAHSAGAEAGHERRNNGAAEAALSKRLRSD
jgi:hypothetical protein